ncbi:hypothetical protein [Streptomyces albipurpureus]|uniref:P-type ATPase A domain-containing protein n=1 Tax=Streptomyces albipurpureus TaxID=2897419 RepID=A0ABT0UUP5_9ACTN|nr:hypothetical protein [Streptomyces sp. CWNU-1]MCM2392117.1 hypothetical protein [Streptomyces sp. CWNU-1]
MELGTRDAVSVLRDGSEALIPVGQLSTRDRFAVRPGERTTTDGTVTEGDLPIGISMLGAESEPVDMPSDETVTRGTVNASDRLAVRAARSPRSANSPGWPGSSRTPRAGSTEIQRLVDRISVISVPVVRHGVYETDGVDDQELPPVADALEHTPGTPCRAPSPGTKERVGFPPASGKAPGPGVRAVADRPWGTDRVSPAAHRRGHTAAGEPPGACSHER